MQIFTAKAIAVLLNNDFKYSAKRISLQLYPFLSKILYLFSEYSRLSEITHVIRKYFWASI
jgi:hypothetical protein